MSDFKEYGVVNRYAFIESPVQQPVGRFTYLGPEQDEAGIIYMAFAVPSKSRQKKRQYKLLLDPFKMRTSCGCEFKQIHRGFVDVTNLPSPCCWHLVHLALWVRRKANKQKLDDMRLALAYYYEQQKKDRRAS